MDSKANGEILNMKVINFSKSFSMYIMFFINIKLEV
jgi:hypothetical protein